VPQVIKGIGNKYVKKPSLLARFKLYSANILVSQFTQKVNPCTPLLETSGICNVLFLALKKYAFNLTFLMQ